MNAADIPQTLNEYFRDAAIAFAHPRSYLQRLELDEDQLFVRGAKFTLKSIALTVLLLVPVMWFHDRRGDLEIYALVLLFGVIFYGGAIHLCLKLFGGTGTIRQTIGAYGYFLGTLAPLRVIIGYPLFLKFGPELALAASPKAISAQFGEEIPYEDAAFILKYLAAISVFEIIWLVISLVPNMAYVHRFSTQARSLGALFLPIVAVFVLTLIFG